MSVIKFDPDAPRTRDLIEAGWPVALRLQQFGYKEISAETGASVPMATAIVRHWVTNGKVRLIETARTGGRNRNFYEVIPQGEIALPIGGDAYDQMWTVMRKFGSFSPTDLVAHCAVPVELKAATGYCQTLLAAGYLKVTQKAKPPHKQATYRLFNHTGPRAPRARNVRCLIDANIGKTLPLVGGAS